MVMVTGRLVVGATNITMTVDALFGFLFAELLLSSSSSSDNNHQSSSSASSSSSSLSTARTGLHHQHRRRHAFSPPRFHHHHLFIIAIFNSKSCALLYILLFFHNHEQPCVWCKDALQCLDGPLLPTLLLLCLHLVLVKLLCARMLVIDFIILLIKELCNHSIADWRLAGHALHKDQAKVLIGGGKVAQVGDGVDLCEDVLALAPRT